MFLNYLKSDVKLSTKNLPNSCQKEALNICIIFLRASFGMCNSHTNRSQFGLEIILAFPLQDFLKYSKKANLDTTELEVLLAFSLLT